MNKANKLEKMDISKMSDADCMQEYLARKAAGLVDSDVMSSIDILVENGLAANAIPMIKTCVLRKQTFY